MDIGTTREVPLSISSSDEEECESINPIEIAMEDVVGRYC